MEAFGRESPPGRAFGVMSELGQRVAKRNSFRSREFSIISRRESILLLCLAWIEATVVATVDATALVIDLGGGVYDLGVSCDFFKTGDCCRELVFVCELGKVVRRQGFSSCSCTTLKQSGFQKQRRYKAVNEGLQA